MALHYFENCSPQQYAYKVLNYIAISLIMPEPVGVKRVTVFESNQPLTVNRWWNILYLPFITLEG